MAVVLDADAIIGFLDRSDALHEAATRAIGEHLDRGEERLVASAVTYAEVLTGVLLGHQDERPVRGFFAELVAEVIAVDIEIAEAAARLRSEGRLRMPDALVLATAERQPGGATVLTGDLGIARLAAARTGLRAQLLSA